MKAHILILSLFAALSLNGCAASIKDPITPEEKAQYGLGNISVTCASQAAEKIKEEDNIARTKFQREEASKPLDQLISENVKRALHGMHGNKTADVSIEIYAFDVADTVTVMSINVVDALAGTVIITDSKTKAVIGQFNIVGVDAHSSLHGPAMWQKAPRQEVVRRFAKDLADRYGLKG